MPMEFSFVNLRGETTKSVNKWYCDFCLEQVLSAMTKNTNGSLMMHAPKILPWGLVALCAVLTGKLVSAQPNVLEYISPKANAVLYLNPVAARANVNTIIWESLSEVFQQGNLNPIGEQREDGEIVQNFYLDANGEVRIDVAMAMEHEAFQKMLQERRNSSDMRVETIDGQKVIRFQLPENSARDVAESVIMFELCEGICQIQVVPGRNSTIRPLTRSDNVDMPLRPTALASDVCFYCAMDNTVLEKWMEIPKASRPPESGKSRDVFRLFAQTNDNLLEGKMEFLFAEAAQTRAAVHYLQEMLAGIFGQEKCLQLTEDDASGANIKGLAFHLDLVCFLETMQMWFRK